MMRRLTDKQKAWAQAYIGPAKFNASEAARIAGISEAEGRKNRSKPHVVTYIEELLRECLQRRTVSQDRIIEEIVSVALSDLADVLTVTESDLVNVKTLDSLPRHVTSAVRKIKLSRRQVAGKKDKWEEVLEIELHDKVKALGLLAQHLGLLKGSRGTPSDHVACLEIIAPVEEVSDPRKAAKICGRL